MSVEETLAAIDAAVGCQQCGRPLNGSVSDDFDSEECQAEWHAARALELVDDDPVQVSLRINSAALESALVMMQEGCIAFARDMNRALAASAELLRARGTAATIDHGHPRPEIATREANE